MSDLMDVDTPPALPDLPDTTDATLLLRQALHPFIRHQTRYMLGAEVAEAFQPAPNATLFTLLRFILDKWQSMFEDSSLGAHKETIQLLKELVRQERKEETAHKEQGLAERLLVALGHSSLAAKGAAANVGPGMRGEAGGYLKLVSGGRVREGEKMMVVLDGSNVAWRHGVDRFSLRGAAEALEYFSTRGHMTVLFLPEGRLKTCEREVDRVYWEALRRLEGSELLVMTPEKDYDDTYMVMYARKRRAVLVSNDRFRDHVYQASAEGEDREWRRWLDHCCVTFTFCGDEFLPNPAFNWHKAMHIASQLQTHA